MALQRVIIFLVLLCISQTFQLPIETAKEKGLSQPRDATEQARVMWNNAKKFQRRVRPARRREKRETEGTSTVTISESELETLAGVAPQYILDIYRNLTSTNMHTQANTIRSLKTVQSNKEPVCGWFNFSLESIHRREFVLSVQLVLQIRHSALLDLKEKYYVVINRARHGNEPEFATSQDVLSRQRGPIEFDIHDATTKWLKNSEAHPHRKLALQVQVYDSMEAYVDGQPPMACESSPLQFHYTTPEPLLVVDSFDPEKEDINYYLFSGSVTTTASERKRRSTTKRQSPTTVRYNPTCRVHDLHVQNTDLNNLPLIRGQTVKVPQQYNAGICGGECLLTLPRVPQHALLIHVLIGRNSFADHGYSFQQCCAPVSYNALDVISTKNTNQVVQITRFKNMQIQKCECIDVVVFNGE